MKSLKITNTSGVSTLVPHNSVLSLTVSAGALITSVSYIDTAGAATTTSVSAFNGANDKYEFGSVTDGYGFSAMVANYKTT